MALKERIDLFYLLLRICFHYLYISYMIDDRTISCGRVRLVVRCTSCSTVCTCAPAQPHLAPASRTAARVCVWHIVRVLRGVRAARVPVLRPRHVGPRRTRARSAAPRVPRRRPFNSNSKSHSNAANAVTCSGRIRPGGPQPICAESARSARLVCGHVARAAGARLRALLRVASRALVGRLRAHRRYASERQENQLIFCVPRFFPLFVQFHFQSFVVCYIIFVFVATCFFNYSQI